MPEFGVLVSFMFDWLRARHRVNFRTLGLCLVVEDMALTQCLGGRLGNIMRNDIRTFVCQLNNDA